MMIVGIDISKDSFDVAYQVEGQWIDRHYRQTPSGYSELLKQLRKHRREAPHLLMEATGTYHLRLATFLVEAGIAVSIVNPLIIKRYGQMRLLRAKTDKADARLICDYGRHQVVPLWQPDPEWVSEIKQLESWQASLIKQRTMVSNHAQSLSHHPQPHSQVMESMQQQLQLIDQQLHDIEQQLETRVRTVDESLYKILISIKGMGRKTAVALMAITHGFTRFDHLNQLLAYTGLSPRVFESGTSIKGRGAISKTGNGRVRQLLYMCAWTAALHNPACKALARRLKDKGKPHKVIRIAVAHKLLKQAFTLAKKREMYDPEYAI